MDGWVKLHRKFLKWEWADVPEMVALFLHLLLKATHKPFSWHGVELEPGQCIIGRKSLSKATGISERKIRTCITRLKSTNEVTFEATKNYSIVTINNWKDYQEATTEDRPSDRPRNRQSSDQAPTTYKNNKNNKNNIYIVVQEVVSYLNAKASKKFKPTSKQTREYISARLSEGFTLEDFKRVIDTKTSQWLHDPRMSAYLRPETLFRPSKFESYLNEENVDEGSLFNAIEKLPPKETRKNLSTFLSEMVNGVDA